MKKDDYINLANELEVELEGDATIAEIKVEICDALIAERSELAEEVAGLNAELNTAQKSIEAKAPVIKIGDANYKYLGVKHIYKLNPVTAEILANNAELAEECVASGVGFLVKL